MITDETVTSIKQQIAHSFDILDQRRILFLWRPSPADYDDMTIIVLDPSLTTVDSVYTATGRVHDEIVFTKNTVDLLPSFSFKRIIHNTVAALRDFIGL